MKVVKKLFLLTSGCGIIFAGTSVVVRGQKNIGYDCQLNHQRSLVKNSGFAKTKISKRSLCDRLIGALKQFQVKPLRISWLENAQPITITDHPKVYSAVKQALIAQDKTKIITTKRVVDHIKILKGELVPGLTSQLSLAAYSGLHWEYIKIKAIEEPGRILPPAFLALKKFNSNNPLNIPSLGWYPIDPIYANSYRPSLFLRKALVQQDTTHQITSAVAQDITFGKNLLHRARRLSTVIATYQGHSTPIQVNETGLNWRPGILRYGFDNSHWTFDAVAAFWKNSPSASKRYYAQYDVTIFKAGWANLYNYVFKQSHPWITFEWRVIHWMESYAAGFSPKSGAYYNFIDVIGKGLYDVRVGWGHGRAFAEQMDDLIKFLKVHKTISKKQRIHVWFLYYALGSHSSHFNVSSGAKFI